jgi:iron complex outermembrane receptor protein
MKLMTGASVLSLAVAALGSATAARAQGQSEQQGLQEIVVTAQKRAENAQSVPVAITAISGSMLQAKG